MKKVGLVSIFRTGNYGGTLQAFATLQAIKINGLADARIINYCCDAIRGKIDKNYLRKAGIMRTAAAIVDKACYMPRMKKVNRFVDSFVDMPELQRADLPALNEQYDVFLSGSDQLWNPDIQQGDFFYLLDFVQDSVKKRSYASSFGKKQLPDQYHAAYRALLSEYQMITVREKAGADLVEQLLGWRPQVVLDPTLLLTREQWNALLPASSEAPYLFTYRLTYSRLLTDVVRAVQSGKSLPVVSSPFLLGYCPRQKARPDLDPLEWVCAIRDSDYVVTDSFHAVVFAIIFSRPFYYVITTPTARERLSRLETLLAALGIENRMVENAAQCRLDEEIDYDSVQEKLSFLREDSLCTLQKLLG